MTITIKPKTYHLISLGCAKNLVDSEGVKHLLRQMDYLETPNPAQAQFIIVNTCGFINDARKESVQTLRECVQKKRKGQKILAMGCLTQRYQRFLFEEIPGLDGMVGTRDLLDILPVIEAITNFRKNKACNFPEHNQIRFHEQIPGYAIQGKSSYLKIADGCDRNCAFCAIPTIKGPLVSKSTAEIINDAKKLQSFGIKEINLIAQDVTNYAKDRYEHDGLTNLLSELLPQIPEVPWIRLLYLYPGFISNKLIDMIASSGQLLPYLDIPLQHSHPDVLRSMNRLSYTEGVIRTIEKIRKLIPNLVVRTTFIVGFPTESDAYFENLKSFLQAVEFDHVGIFNYSFEKNTPAELLGDPIPLHIKEQRRQELMLLQANISYHKNLRLVGKTLDILIEGVDIDHAIVVGRSYRDAPEIDGLVIAEGFGNTGDILKVRITGAMQHDLYGILLPNNDYSKQT